MITFLQNSADVQETVEVSVSVPSEGYGLFDFADGGFIMYPVTFCALMVLVLVARTVWRMKSLEIEMSTLVRSSIDAILFWGFYALVLGILGTVVGLSIAAQAVELAGEVHPTLVWGGIRVSLTSTLYGLLILSGSGLFWFALRHWHRRAVFAVSRSVRG